MLLALCAASCGSAGADHTPGRLCTPAAWVYCLCPGKDYGTKQCKDDGAAFGPCLPCESTDAAGSGGVLAPAQGCGAKPNAIAAEQTLHFEGDLGLATAIFQGSAACATGVHDPDLDHVVEAGVDGTIAVELDVQEGLDAVLYVRKATCEKGAQVACDAGVIAGSRHAFVPVQAGVTYHIVVDGRDGSVGSYALAVTLYEQAICGDATIEVDEMCDDGNTQAADGCSPLCAIEAGAQSALACPGAPLHVWSLPVELTMSTSPPGAYESSCGGAGAETVLRVEPHRSGVLRASVTATTFDAVLHARVDGCADGQSAGCTNGTVGPGVEQVSFAVLTGRPLWLFVDALQGDGGAFSLRLEWQ